MRFTDSFEISCGDNSPKPTPSREEAMGCEVFIVDLDCDWVALSKGFGLRLVRVKHEVRCCVTFTSSCAQKSIVRCRSVEEGLSIAITLTLRGWFHTRLRRPSRLLLQKTHLEDIV